MMRSEIISRKFIKPSSPTPDHLKTFKLSLLDQITPSIHGNMTFFYTFNDNSPSFSSKSQLLQDSLSKTVTLFYQPLAGRLHDSATIACNDKGIIFVEALIDTQLLKVLEKPDFNSLDDFLPTTDAKTLELSDDAMLLVQFSGFACGSVAISLSLNHKLADLSSFITLLQSWTSICRGSEKIVIPQYIGASVFPPKHDLLNMSASVNIAGERFYMRRFVFKASKINELKAKVDKQFGEAISQSSHPSKVEVILALIWRCALLADKSVNRTFKPSALFQAVNLRQRMNPKLPETAIGNFIWPFMVILQDEEDMELHKLVISMRKAFNKFCNDHESISFRGEEGSMAILRELNERREFFKTPNVKNMKIFKCSSWCKFPVYESADLGWGKPIWHVSLNKIVNNTIALADTRSSDGIEALVTLDEEEMEVFERNEELLQYASVNPSACVMCMP